MAKRKVKKKKRSKRSSSKSTKDTSRLRVNQYLAIALVVVLAVSAYFVIFPKDTTPETISYELEAEIIGADCEDCFDINQLVQFVKSQPNVVMEEVEELSMEESKELIEKYGITKLPALLIEGDVEGISVPQLEKVEDGLLFKSAPAPYYDVEEARVKGLVKVTSLVDETCEDCFDISAIVTQFQAVGLKVVEENTVDVKSDEGKALVEKYTIEKVPTLVLNDEALAYDIVAQAWEQVGSQEEDGNLVLRLVSPPYLNLDTNKVEGRVTLTRLVDETCETCFDEQVLVDAMETSFNLFIQKDETIDVTSRKGEMFIAKYKIEKVPTIIFSKDLAAYPGMDQAWEQAGTIEYDGKFVFRKIDLLEAQAKQQGMPSFVHKDLTSGEEIDAMASE